MSLQISVFSNFFIFQRLLGKVSVLATVGRTFARVYTKKCTFPSLSVTYEERPPIWTLELNCTLTSSSLEIKGEIVSYYQHP